MIRQVTTPAAPPPAGHYSQAVAASGLIFVSGQLPHLADGAIAADAPFERQAERALGHLLAIVTAAGGSRETLVRVTVYITDVAQWPAFDAVYARMMGATRPARTVVPVPALHFGYAVEIDGIALETASA